MRPDKTIMTPPIIAYHLDLKGVQIRSNHIPQLLADLAGQGINTVLVEYEDTFPFTPPVRVAWDPKTSFTTVSLRAFIKEANRCGIEIIPLQQCMGHLEYLLRWKRYAGFAQNQDYPSTLRLDKPKARAFVREMLRQVMEAHPDSRFIHLGMDEARNLNESPLVRKRGAVLPVFMEYLEELCDWVEKFGKTPIIFTDMIENHFQVDTPLARFKDRIILMPWDYTARGEWMQQGQILGTRIGRKTALEAQNCNGGGVHQDTKFVEDLPKDIRRVIKPYYRNGHFKTLWQVDYFTKLGFRVIGAAAGRVSADGAVLPSFRKRRENVEAWSQAIQRNHQMGLCVTSWARGNSFSPPNFNIDLCWPSITSCTQLMGARPPQFWSGIPDKPLEKLLWSISQFREGSAPGKPILEIIRRWLPRIKTHRYEWQSLTLMVMTLELQRKCAFACEESVWFGASRRIPPLQWQRLIRDHERCEKEIITLRRRVEAHFSKRYHGKAFQDWLCYLFGPTGERLRDSLAFCRTQRKKSARLN